MPTDNMNHFDATMLSVGFAQKTSLARYRELRDVFPNVLIIFEHGDYYYGFDETAVAMYDLFGSRYYQQKGMLVVKIEKDKFETHMIAKRQMRRFRYLVDRNGELTFEKGEKLFHLQKPLSYYAENPDKVQNNKPETSYWNDPITRHGGGWYDDAWTPGLPSSRMYGKEEKP